MANKFLTNDEIKPSKRKSLKNNLKMVKTVKRVKDFKKLVKGK